jgi:hypothetical protein
MSNQYPPSGVLFTNDRKQKPNQPDYTGDLELSDEVINDLVEQMSRGTPKPKIRLAGWKKTSNKTGKVFVSLTGSKFEERQQAPQTQSNDTPLADDIPF